VASNGTGGERHMKVMLLAGLNNTNKLALAKLASSYQGTQPLKVLSGIAMGVGKDSTGKLVLLKLSATGEFVG
jgi:hypothetical protein